MAIKAVETIRKIRDNHYEQTKNFSPEEQIEFHNKKSKDLRKKLKKSSKRLVIPTLKN
ncbi:hypothetical protein KKB18_05945 [bacterium]|nr:hypothetical protein [bacterium]